MAKKIKRKYHNYTPPGYTSSADIARSYGLKNCNINYLQKTKRIPQPDNERFYSDILMLEVNKLMKHYGYEQL